MADNFFIQLLARLNRQASINQLNKDVKSLEKTPFYIRLTGMLNRSATQRNIHNTVNSISRNTNVTVNARVSERELRQSYENAVNNIETQAQNNPINIPVRVDTGSIDLNDIPNAQAEINNQAETMRTVFADYVGIREIINRINQAIQKAIENVTELNKAQTDLQIATGKSAEQMKSLMADYNQLAKDMSSTTVNTTDAADQFLRQGKSISETNELIRDSLILSKIGQIDSADATTYLTSVMNGFKVETEDVISVVDKLSATDMAAAVSSGGLAESMSKCANSADVAGVSMDSLIGYIATVSEVTQKSSSVVGESFKTILARMGKIRLNDWIDEDGTDISGQINDVEKVLGKFDIKLRESATEFRDFEDVIYDVGMAWEDFTSVDQNAIANAFGGVYQRENVLTLFNNFSRALELTEVSANSAGTALEKFAIYEDSLEAATNRLTASLEGLAYNNISADFLKELANGTAKIIEFVDSTKLIQTGVTALAFTGAIRGILLMGTGMVNLRNNVVQYTQAMDMSRQSTTLTQAQLQQLAVTTQGLTQAQLRLVVSSNQLTTQQRLTILTANGMTQAEAQAQLQTWGLTGAVNAQTTATFSLRGAWEGLKAAIVSNPIGLVVTVLTTATMAITTFKQKQEELRQSIKDTAEAVNEEINNLKDLYNTYLDIGEAVSNGTKTKEDLQTATNNLIETLKDEGIEVDELVKKYGNLSEAINKAMIDSIKEKLPDLSAGVTANADTLIEEGNKSVDGMSHDFALSDKDADFYDFVTEFIKEYEKINGDDVFTSTFEGFDTYRLFVGSNQAGKVGTVTEYKQQLDALTALRQSLFEEYGADVEDNAFYNSITERINALKPLYEEYEKSLAEYNAYNAAVVVGESKLTDEPDNFKEYIKYKNDLIEKVLNDENNSGFRGSDEDIKNSISEYLLSDSDLSAFENRLNMLSEAKKQFIAYEGSQKFNFLSGLSDENLEIALKIPDLFEDGLDGATQKILDWKANPDNVITPEVGTKIFSDMADEVSSKTKLMSTAMEEMSCTGHISASTYSEIMEMGGSFAECLEIQNGQLVLNVQKLKELETQEYKNKISENNLTIAMLQREAATRAMSNGDWQSISAMITELQKENEFNQLLIDEINNTKPDNKGKEDTTDYNKANFEAEKAKRKHWIEMGKDDQGKKYTEDMYYAWLDSAEGYKKYFSDLTKYQSEYWQCEEECYNYIVSSAEKNANAELDVLKDKFDKGIILTDEYVAGVNAIYDKYKDKNGNSLLSDDFLGDSLDPEKLYDSRLEEWKKANNYDENDLDSRKNFAEYRKSLATEMFGDEKSDSHNPKKLAEETKEADEEIADVWKDRVEREKTYWESLQTQVEDYYDNEIKKLQEIADEEKRINKQEELRNNLIKARQELENAKKNKNQLVFVDGMFKYMEDQEAVLTASKKVDDAEQAIVDNNRETEMALLEEQKNNASEFYKNILKKFDDYINHLDGKDIPTVSDTEVMGAVSDYAGNTPKKLYTISEAADILCERYGIDKNSDVWKNFATNVISNNPPILPMPSIQNNIYNNNYNTPVSVNGVNVRVNGGLSQKEVEDIVSDGIETFAREVSARLTCLSYKVH